MLFLWQIRKHKIKLLRQLDDKEARIDELVRVDEGKHVRLERYHESSIKLEDKVEELEEKLKRSEGKVEAVCKVASEVFQTATTMKTAAQQHVYHNETKVMLDCITIGSRLRVSFVDNEPTKVVSLKATATRLSGQDKSKVTLKYEDGDRSKWVNKMITYSEHK